MQINQIAPEAYAAGTSVRPTQPMATAAVAHSPAVAIALGHAGQAAAAPVETRRPTPPPAGVLDDTTVTSSFDRSSGIMVIRVASARSGEMIAEIPSAELRTLAARMRESLETLSERDA